MTLITTDGNLLLHIKTSKRYSKHATRHSLLISEHQCNQCNQRSDFDFVSTQNDY
jgi:hypothetical protein